MRDRFSVNVKFCLTTRVRGFYTILIHLSFPSDIRDNIWVGLCLGAGVMIGLGLFSDRNIVPGSTKNVDPGTFLTCKSKQNHAKSR